MHTRHSLFRVSMKRAWIAVTLLVILSGNGFALIEGPVPLDVLIQYAPTVVQAKIETAAPQKSDGVECGIRYSAIVQKSFKRGPGDSVGKRIVFGRLPGLQVGHSYILFLHPVMVTELYERLREHIDLKESDDHVMTLIRCNGLAPGFESGRSIWEVVGDKVELDGLVPQPWPDAVPMHRKIDPPIAVISRQHLFSYLESWTPAPTRPDPTPPANFWHDLTTTP